MSSSFLSTHESAIYDRQIRLWGSSAQMRIKSGKVLFVGISATAAEMCKNVLLAGANLIIADDGSVSPESTNFLIALEIDPVDQQSMTVGQATAKAVSQLNEHPSVEAIGLAEVRNYIASADSVVVSIPRIEVATALVLSDQCRQLGKSFFIVFDSLAANWCFADMGEMHVVESHTAPLRRDERTGDRSSDKRVIEFQFTPFQMFLKSEIELNIANPKPSFPLAEVLFVKLYLEFFSLTDSANKEAPSPKRTHISASSKFGRFVDERLAVLAAVEGRIGKTFSSLKDSLTQQLRKKYEVDLHRPSPPHLAAIHGALVSQEIVKFITKRDVPLVNQIVLNPNDCGCLVVKTPMSLSSRILSSEDSVQQDEVEVIVTANALD